MADAQLISTLRPPASLRVYVMISETPIDRDDSVGPFLARLIRTKQKPALEAFLAKVKPGR